MTVRHQTGDFRHIEEGWRYSTSAYATIERVATALEGILQELKGIHTQLESMQVSAAEVANAATGIAEAQGVDLDEA